MGRRRWRCGAPRGAQHGPVVCHHGHQGQHDGHQDAEEGHSDLQLWSGTWWSGEGTGAHGRVPGPGQLGWGCGQWLQPGVEAKLGVAGLSQGGLAVGEATGRPFSSCLQQGLSLEEPLPY